MPSIPEVEDRITQSRWSTTIGSLCDRFGGEVQTGPFGSQLHASDYAPDGIPVVMPQDIRDGHIVCDRIAKVPPRHADRLVQHTLRAGDVVFSRRGDVSRFAVVTAAESGWLCGTGSIRIRLNCPDIYIPYARRYLQQDLVRGWLERNAKGLTMPNLNTAVIRALPFVYPPMAEQRRIAKVLDRAEALRAKRRAALSQLDTLTQAIFLDLFGDPARNTKGLRTVSIGDLGEWQSGGTPSRGREDYFMGSVPWFSSGELNEMVVSESEEHISDLALRETSAKVVPTGALMLGMYDTAALKASIAGVPCSCNQAIAFARINSRIAETVFVYFAIVIGREHFRRLQRGIRQKNLNLSMIRELRIPLPDMAIQRKFARHVASTERLRTSQLASLAELDTLFAVLQHRAFRGEL